MTAADIIKLGTEMRTAQKAYFRNRTHDALLKSKELERQFDNAAHEFLEGGQTLFDKEGRPQ